MSQENNPLLKEYNTPFNTPPFSEIENTHFLPAVREAIKMAEKEVEAIIDNSASPDYENTIEAIEFNGKKLSQISSILFNLNSAETSDELQGVVKEASPLLSKHSNEIWQNQALFSRVKSVYEQKDDLNLSGEQVILLSNIYKAFVRSGANLSEADRKIFQEISMEISTLKLQFGENVLAETNAYELVIEDEKDLSGLPESAKIQASEVAKQKGQEGKWIFTLQAPSYIPFIENVDNRSLREQFYKAFTSKANKGNEHDNKEVVGQIITLRAKLSSLLGYESYAAYVLEERMAGSVHKVNDFLEDLLKTAKPLADEEVAEIKEFAVKKDGLKNLQKWDWPYYSEKLKKEKYAIDDEILRPYFKLENVLNGVFQTVERLYGLVFEHVPELPVYHKDVMAYEVKDQSGKHISVFYADFHPRAGKRGGAWMTSYRSQMVENGEGVRPVVSIVCNFTPSTEDQPSLLTFNEVLTLFHEFGHALHGMLANTTYPSLSGTGVYWDFVELPSQIFENWCYEKECLDLFAKHYQTGELIPQEYIDKLKASSTFQEAYKTIRQLSFSFLDMSWFSLNKDNAAAAAENPAEFENKALASTELFPTVEGSLVSTQFSHIFAGGYSAGYYSYKWAEVLDADAFSLFKENGIFDKATAASFKDTVLSKGGSVHPMELYKQFMGREPKVDALLKRAGLVK